MRQLWLVPLSLLLLSTILSNNISRVLGVFNSQCSDSYVVENIEYHVEVTWSLEQNIVSFNITVENSNVIFGGNPENGFWIGLGFSNKTAAPFMFPADVIIATFPNSGSSAVSDRYTVSASTPLVDNFVNIYDVTTFKDNAMASLAFKRNLITSDPIYDVPFNVPRYWIWAIGELDHNNILLQHSNKNRGTVLQSAIILPGPSDCSSEPTASLVVELLSTELSELTTSLVVEPTTTSLVVESPSTPLVQSTSSPSTTLPVSTTLVESSTLVVSPSPSFTPVPPPPVVCESDTTNSNLYGSYMWPQTNADVVAIVACVHGAPFGVGPANATRLCFSNGTWDVPDYSACRDTLPEVVVSPSGQYTVEVGRRISISCAVGGVYGEYSIEWFRVNQNNEKELVESLTSFNYNNLDGFNLAANRTVQSFQDNLFYIFLLSHDEGDYQQTFRKDIISWEIVLELGKYTVSPSKAVSGTYICRGEHEVGSREATVTINVEAPSVNAGFSRTYIRQTADYDHIVPYTDPEFQLAIIESKFLDAISARREGLQTIKCKDVTPCLENIDEENEEEVSMKRLECLIKEFPPQDSTASLGDEVLNVYRSQAVVNSSYSSETGFCDPDHTTDKTYGNYTWPEAAGGQTISLSCPAINNTYVKRLCLGSVQGWNTIDYTDCREVVQLPIQFQFYLRFTSNYDSTLGPEIAADNIRISIELSSDAVLAECTSVSIETFNSTNQARVECEINGTSELESGAKSTEEAIINDLVSQSLLVPNTNTSNVNGYCDTETTEGSVGTITWPESAIGTEVRALCPLGPTEASMATRVCVSRSQWGSPMTNMCATEVSQELQTLGNTIDTVTADNVAEFTSNLTSLVVSALSMADQTEENVQIVSQSLTRALELVETPNVSLSTRLSVITNIVTILDDVEEWPMQNIKEESPSIIMTFESIAGNLVQQENFTDLTVATVDVTLVAGRVESDTFEQNGRTFSVRQVNGMLQVNTSIDESSRSLQNDQSAILSFPSGIDLGELIGSDKQDVGIFFVAYNEDLWFPVTVTEQRPPQNPVGSAVVSFSIAGLPEGTALPEPVSITLRITDPDTGRTENITEAKCVFYNFEMLMWDPSGCETIYDPNTDPSIVTCTCSHLTNFAALVDISARIDDPPELTEEQVISLNAITYIGVILSLIGLIMTFVTLLIFKKLRQRDVTKFHLQLCVALACMYLVFVCGIGSTDNRGGCVTVGTMIQYFTLVAWMWMGAEALLMFQKLIIVFGTKTWKYLLLVSVVCWSVPLIFVVIPVAIDPDYYITTFDNSTTRSGFCFISDIGVFFGAFLGPIFLVIIFNTVIFILVIRVLLKHNLDKKKYKLEKSSMTATEALKLLLSISGILVLFGLSWIFAVFTFVTDGNTSFAFQFIFAFFNAFQGFWIFFFFVLLNSEARDSWRQLVFKAFKISNSKSSGKFDLSSSSKNTYISGSSKANESSVVVSNDYSTAPIKYSKKNDESDCSTAPDKLKLTEKELEVREFEKESSSMAESNLTDSKTDPSDIK